MIRSIVIAGGGAAGWITAGVIAAHYNSRDHAPVTITLVESPTIGILGVGEGTWPTMGQTLQRLRLSEHAFIQRCDASFKQGTKFRRWVTGAPDDCYYHPFSMPHGFEDISLFAEWRENRSDVPFAHAVGLQPTLCDQKRGPKQADMAEFASVENYGYHLDAHKFAQMLSEHCTRELGVRHIEADICGVNSAENGDIRSLSTKQGIEIAGDLFIDCSGSASLLIGKHYEVPFLSRKDILFIDRALAVQIPYESETSPIESATLSTAQSSGWIWDIGLASRRGVGHVFSSTHTDADKAAVELRDYIRPRHPDADSLQLRELRFDPGFRERFWFNNCVAVGMAAGFLEPLEASALIMVELAASTIAAHLPASREGMDTVAKLYNERFRFRWDRIVDFLKLHYVLSQRSDTAFWRNNRDEASIPQSLRDQLALWRHQAPSNNGFLSPLDLFPAASYQYILYGMGYPTAITDFDRTPARRQFAAEHLQTVEERKAKVPPLLPTNRKLVTAIGALDLHGRFDVEKDSGDTWVAVADADIVRMAEHYPLFFRRDLSIDRYVCVALLGLQRGKQLLSPDMTSDAPVNAISSFASQITDLGLLEPVKLDVKLNNQQKLSVSGVHAINRARLGQVPAEVLDPAFVPMLRAMMDSTRHVQALISKANRLIPAEADIA